MAVTTLFSAKASTYDSPAIDTGRADVEIEVFSASASSATVKIQEAFDPAGPWHDTQAVITDPDTTGEKWTCPMELSSPYTRVSISAWASGAISCRYNKEIRP